MSIAERERDSRLGGPGMLSRAAEAMYWLSRYVERADNTARLVDMGRRMAALPTEHAHRATEWGAVVLAAGSAGGFPYDIIEADQTKVADWLILSRDNPSSVWSCLRTARSNARMVRSQLTAETWDALNSAWLRIKDARTTDLGGGDFAAFIDWMKQACSQYRGSMENTLLRMEGYDFLQIGAHLERADNTARLLDTKYYVLLPNWNGVGGGVDLYQWSSILQAAGAMRSYHWLYGAEVTPRDIADLLILNPLIPRSLRYCLEVVYDGLLSLEMRHDRRHACHDAGLLLLQRVSNEGVDSLLESGLHEYLGDFVNRAQALSDHIGQAYGFGFVRPSDTGEVPAAAA